MSDTVNILVVDDQAESFEKRITLLPAQLRIGVTVKDPEDVTLEDIDHAQLVLVDYRLDKWASNNLEPLFVKQFPNGLALLAVLQQHAMALNRPTAFAVHSEHLEDLTAPFKPEQRVHLLARTYNIDWAFLKSTRGAPTKAFEKARMLASAIGKLPAKWPEQEPDQARKIARELLAVPVGRDWTNQAWLDVEGAHPPLDEMTLRVHGLLFVRWLLGRVMYYPAFLIHRYWLAARLGTTPQAVEKSLSGKLGELFMPALYVGVLQGFPGRRWWRAGVESILWDVGNQSSLGTADLLATLKANHRIDLKPASHEYPVVCLNGDYLPLPDVHDPSKTVRLQLDDWPSYADVPRTTIVEALSDSRLGALVIPSDRKLLDH